MRRISGPGRNASAREKKEKNHVQDLCCDQQKEDIQEKNQVLYQHAGVP
jgi:hypothetical protein